MDSFLTYHPFFIVIVGLIFLFGGIAIALLLINMLYRAIHGRRVSYRASVEKAYKKEIFNYLIVGEISDIRFVRIEKSRNKDLLIGLLLELFDYLEGVDKDRVMELFKREKLDAYCVRKIRSRWCYRKTYYLRCLAMVSLDKELEPVLKDMLRSRFMERRLYAMQALILRNPEDIERLFAAYTYRMSLWEQMNYYLFFISKGIKVPDFHHLALSANPSVALFAIRMVRIYQQRQGSIRGYEILLRHPDLEVRGEMFRTLAEFGYEDPGVLLEEMVPNASLFIRMHIMTYLARISATDTRTMMRYYDESDSIEFRLHILYCIYNFIRGGKEDIEEFAKQDENKLLRDLSTHLITNIV
ncbi:MAG: hypothetical protein PHC95_12220 [Parabacteroides sp.]|nr:hypothetical protein [Parabacteroides sp.]